jgi:putative ABC transport system permease protein
VLAPEGVPSISVSYWALAGPVLLWGGAGLLTWRLTELFLRRGRPVLARGVALLSGPLAATVAASLQRQRRLLARAAAFVALTVAFAASTAVFYATYRQQVGIDALLTNGADITVTRPQGAPTNPTLASSLAATPGVGHVEPMQHRLAYVGNDLQDLYGVNPATIVDATRLQDAYFAGGSARQLIGRLSSQLDAVLVSAETVRDYQLQPGDHITMRLQDGQTHQYVPVSFQYVGVVNEFPTAPRDSFLVANAAYVASATGNDAVDTYLVGARNDVTTVADAVRTTVGPTAHVTDLVTSRRVVGSSLTAVDLAGLTKVELGFAIALAAAATGLVLWLGLAERRRTYAIAAALGATPRQLGAFIWSEAGVVTVAGFAAGAAAGTLLAQMLVKVLTGVFDPPPAALSVPWRYLAGVGAVALASAALAALAALRSARRPAIELLRDL